MQKRAQKLHSVVANMTSDIIDEISALEKAIKRQNYCG